ncbi:radical SAM protein [Colidextribacter sp. OB.20]|uniref:radical SAM protein n=1 Tax=Colidextribacter sp. OB.20 TaxID=2304568 RepID=UPI00136E1A59|nr:radical SAM protein [Colidextribacter sp. OB.20]NBI11100.1 radical SAM protein [Colidextribacter sp. OB.20]
MHFTGTIWRPPYEAASLLIQVTAGCTHHRCKFCTLYHDLPFRLSPLEEVEADLLEVQTALHSPIGKLTAALQGLPVQEGPDRAFLTGANPFVLKTDRLLEIARLMEQYLPNVRTIGCFARITDIGLKTDGELEQLSAAGYDGLTIGVETGDGPSLAFMDKGYTPEDILVQCQRLDRAGIGYSFFYLTGIAGAGQGERSAKASAEIFNRLHPRLVGSSMLTVYPDSKLFQEIQAGNWAEAGEVEKYRELKVLVSHLDIPVTFAALGASNAYQFQGHLPEDREALLSALDRIIAREGEDRLRSYRTALPHL